MATEVLRFAIIGTGAMGLEHIRNIKLLDNAKVTKLPCTSIIICAHLFTHSINPKIHYSI
jgi:predicted dehydrogenase